MHSGNVNLSIVDAFAIRVQNRQPALPDDTSKGTEAAIPVVVAPLLHAGVISSLEGLPLPDACGNESAGIAGAVPSTAPQLAVKSATASEGVIPAEKADAPAVPGRRRRRRKKKPAQASGEQKGTVGMPAQTMIKPTASDTAGIGKSQSASRAGAIKKGVPGMEIAGMRKTSSASDASGPGEASCLLAGAVDSKDVLEVYAQLEKGADPNSATEGGQSLLMIAAANGDAESALALLQFGADYRRPDHSGCTPLMAAVKGGNKKLVDVLSRRVGIDIDARDEQGRTALCWALKKKQPLHMDSLIFFGADPNQLDHYGRTMLSAAIMDLHAQPACKVVVAALLKAGASVDAQALQGYTALIHAARLGKLDLVRQLCLAGARLNLREHMKHTALMKAAVNNRADVVTFLLERSASIDLCDEDGASALTLAANKGHAGIVRLLLAHKARVRDIDLLAAAELPAICALLRPHLQ